MGRMNADQVLTMWKSALHHTKHIDGPDRDDFIQGLCELGMTAFQRWKPELGAWSTFCSHTFARQINDLYRRNILGFEGGGDVRQKKAQAFKGRTQVNERSLTTEGQEEDAILRAFWEFMELAIPLLRPSERKIVEGYLIGDMPCSASDTVLLSRARKHLIKLRKELGHGE